MPKTILDPAKIKFDAALGLPPLPETPPDLPYFVPRTRTYLYPLYRSHEIIGRDYKTYWKNRWDGKFNKYHEDILQNLDEIKWENNEKTVTFTKVNKIQGDIWRFERDARDYLEQQNKYVYPLDDSVDSPKANENGERILSSVNEVRGTVKFQGDFVTDLFQFLMKKGF